jgi:hypothetical protein
MVDKEAAEQNAEELRRLIDETLLSGCAKVLDYLNTWPCGLVKADLYVGQ